jgi:hypothetical protein
MKTTNLFQNRIETSLIIIAALLIAVWPLPETMAYRHLLLLSGMIASVMILRQSKVFHRVRDSWPLWVLIGFFVWMTIHLIFLSRNFDEQLYEYQGDLLRSLLATCIGAGVGVVINSRVHGHSNACNSKHEAIIIGGLSGTLLIYAIRYAYEVFTTHQFLHLGFFVHPFREKPAIVVFGSVFLTAMLLKMKDSMAGIANKVWLSLAGIAVPLLVFSYYTTNTKNGFLSLVLTLLIFGAGAAWDGLRAKRMGFGTAVTSIVILLAIGYGIKLHIDSNPAWQTMTADVAEAADIEKNQTWKNRDVNPMPLNRNGVQVNGSTYDRTAWAVAGMTLIRENPLGYGLINHSFGALALGKWPDFYKPNGKTRGATHSGWIDFTLGVGLPGLLLVIVPLLAAFTRALSYQGFWYRYTVLTIPVVLFVYLTTEVATGHYIEFLFFLTAMLCGLTLKADADRTN